MTPNRVVDPLLLELLLVAELAELAEGPLAWV